MAPPIIVTEDTPPDMLAGSMDLTVVLPDGHSLKMSVERSTPMMDLLVQVTTANKMSTGGYIIKPLNERGPLPYKPSTPIGALDTWTIHIEPKQHPQCTAIKNSLKTLNQPFEQTFRLQVHLPRNQLYVARVSPKTRLTDILIQVCSEKNLDPLKYSLRHPSNLDQVLSLSCSLADYKLQEVTLVCNRNHPLEVSSVDIMSLQRETSNPAYRNTMREGSVSSGSLEGRSLSPVPSDESSASPPPLPPSRPIRKRRPAPKPPTISQKTLNEEKQLNGVQSSTVFYHSRNSSDSSGYHEASVLSESPQSNSVPESLSQRKMASVSEAPLSQSMTDVTAIEPLLQQATSYNSITSLSSVTGRKKKTAPPPPPPPPVAVKTRTSSLSEEQQRTPSVSSTASSTTTLDGNEVNVAVKSATLPPSSRLNSVPKELSPPSSPPPATKVDVEPPTTPQVAPAPQPRSKVMIGLEKESQRDLEPSAPPPQPKPRTLLTHSLAIENHRCENEITEIQTFPEETGSLKRRSVFMNKIMPSSMFKTHKACINELALKFDVKDSADSAPALVEVHGEYKADNQNQLVSIDSNSIPTISDKIDEDTDVGKPVSSEMLKIREKYEREIFGNSHLTATLEANEKQGPTAWVMGPNTGPDAEPLDIRMADEEIDRIFSNATKDHTSLEFEIEDQIMSLPSLPSPPSSLTHCEFKQTSDGDNPLDWEYRLPAPPTFRDECKSPSVTEFGTVTVANFSDIIYSENIKHDILPKTNIIKDERLEEIAGLESVKHDNSSKINVQNNIKCETQIKQDSNVLNDLELNSVKNEVNNISNIDGKSGVQSQKGRSMLVENENNKLNSDRNKLIGEGIEQNLLIELSSSVVHKPNKVEMTEIENRRLKPLSSSSTLENFIITTYKDTKPVEVFEDESIKSSVGEKRDKSKDDAVFRAPKPRVKEPNLSRTSSFSIENKLNGPVIKRSVSYVSLLAANMPRNSQPYRAHLMKQNSYTSQDLWPRLRKTTSEINIDDKGGETRETSAWQDDPSELQSVQVLRNILSRSHANLTSGLDGPDDAPSIQHRDPSVSDKKFEDTYDKNADSKKWGRSQSEEENTTWTLKTKIEHAGSLDEEILKPYSFTQRGPPSINLSTWNERPKRQISIKNDCDYASGFGKKSIGQDEISTGIQTNKESISSIQSINRPLYADMAVNEGFKLEGRSKSFTDLSRMPIVRSVELKKPFMVQNFDRISLKPVQISEDINNGNLAKVESSKTDDQRINSDETFVGVNCLARKFGVPQKRPVSLYVNSLNNNNNYQNDNKESTKHIGDTLVNSGKDFSIVNTSTNINESECRRNQSFHTSNESHARITVMNAKYDSTSEIKALAKIRSGGFVESGPIVSSCKEPSYMSHKNHIPLKTSLAKNEECLSSIDSNKCTIPVQTGNSIVLLGDSSQSVISNISIPSNTTQSFGPSKVTIRQSQTLNRKTRPLNLQPVVKGFRVSTEILPSSPKDLTSPLLQNTKDFRFMDSNSSSNVINPDPSVRRKIAFNRAFSAPSSSSLVSTDIKDTTKEKNIIDKSCSLPSPLTCISESKTKTVNIIPPPPPGLPILKPIGDRKGLRLLPPPEADPRDQLMYSIRSFRKDHLKRVSK